MAGSRIIDYWYLQSRSLFATRAVLGRARSHEGGIVQETNGRDSKEGRGEETETEKKYWEEVSIETTWDAAFIEETGRGTQHGKCGGVCGEDIGDGDCEGEA